MPAPRKYDQETRDRAVRMYQDRRRDFPDESALQSRKRVGELLDVSPDTMRGWIERVDIDAGQRPGVPSSVEARIKELERENAELRRANEILKTASAFFAAAELDRRLRRSSTTSTPIATGSGSSRSAGCSPSTSWRSPPAPTTPTRPARSVGPTATTPTWPTP